MMRVFEGLQIALEFGYNQNFKKKTELRKKIIENGGVISCIVTKKCHIVVTSNPEKCDVSLKCRMAIKYGLPVLQQDYIWDSLQAQKLLPYDSYVVGGKSKVLDFKFGKISAFVQSEKAKKYSCKASFNPRTVRIWSDNDSNQPWFSEERHEVAKYAIFMGYSSSKKDQYTTILELHTALSLFDSKNQPTSVVDRSCRETYFNYRVVSQTGCHSDLEAGKPCHKEVHYVSTSEQALAVFAMLYEDTEKKAEVIKCKNPIRGIGSQKLQKLMAEVVDANNSCNDQVKELVDHIWREAMTEVTSVLGDISNIKLEEVEKAEAVLVKVRDAIKTSSTENFIQSLIDEFYSILNHTNESSVVDDRKRWLVKKQDMCQLIKDMIMVSEMTNYETRAYVEAKYAALRCKITCLYGREKDDIENMIKSSLERPVQDLSMINVYEVWRWAEDLDFRHDLDSKQLLFHSSRVENFVGILSRGLLLPKIVVDDYGGTRSDAGMLGSGIYFANAASTSIKYSSPSKTKGSRLLLVNEVALGRSKSYTTYDTGLVVSPEGYNSTHGVSKKLDKSSEFENDEFVVYSINQQRIRYLVEFTIKGDKISPMAEICAVDSNILYDTVENTSLHDVIGIADPMLKVKPGLISTGGQEAELQSVHIRAKLVDLTAQVVVLQEYYNNSQQAIEAKYVFPLDDTAAVCGFEAFINGKHIVGEVKEKETAHKEYKEAIREGHGAYLMDQDDETPDVFTVSVGNLPSGACVLIKITYVAELQIEGEQISFRLPATIAPWKEDSAFKQSTQEELKSHKLTASRTTVQVAIEMPSDILSLHSPTHKIRVKQTATKAYVEMINNQKLEAGFQLLIGLAEIHVPRMWVEQHPVDNKLQACMLTFYPEFESKEVSVGEIILFLDTSNSMKGTSLSEAKKVALLVLKNLPCGWYFNVVRFGSDYEELFPVPRHNLEENIQHGISFVQNSVANKGNTDVMRSLQSLFLLPPTEGQRNVFLISDGHVNDSELVCRISSKMSNTRLFSFGVSAACNIYTLKALSRVSGGAFEFFSSKVKSEWESKVKSQISKACQPGLTSVSVEWHQYDENLPPPVQAPQQITALFSGSHQVVFGFVSDCTMATLTANIDGQEMSTVVSTSELSITKGKLIHCLAARAVIRDWNDGILSRDRTKHELAKMDLKNYIIELSKEYSIVTQFTSCIAVEKREENEKDLMKEAPNIEELVEKENLDFLSYMSWTKVTEEEIVEELSKEVKEQALLFPEIPFEKDLKKKSKKRMMKMKQNDDLALSLQLETLPEVSSDEGAIGKLADAIDRVLEEKRVIPDFNVENFLMENIHIYNEIDVSDAAQTIAEFSAATLEEDELRELEEELAQLCSDCPDDISGCKETSRGPTSVEDAAWGGKHDIVIAEGGNRADPDVLELPTISACYESKAFVQPASSAGFVPSPSSAGFLQSAFSADFVPQAHSAGFEPRVFSAGLVQSAPSAGFLQSAPSAGYVQSAPSAGFVQSAPSAGFVQSAPSASFVQSAPSAGFVQSAPSAGFVQSAMSAGLVQSAPSAGFVQSAPSAGFVQSAPSAGLVQSALTAGDEPSTTSAVSFSGFGTEHTFSLDHVPQAFSPGFASLTLSKGVTSQAPADCVPGMSYAGFGGSSAGPVLDFAQTALYTSFQPQVSSTGFQPQIPSTGFQPQLSSIGFQPQISSTGFQPQLSSTGFQPQLSSIGFQPQLSSTGFQPQLSSTSFQLHSTGFQPHIFSTSFQPQLPSTGFQPHLSSTGCQPQLSSTGFQPQLASTGLVPSTHSVGFETAHHSINFILPTPTGFVPSTHSIGLATAHSSTNFTLPTPTGFGTSCLTDLESVAPKTKWPLGLAKSSLSRPRHMSGFSSGSSSAALVGQMSSSLIDSETPELSSSYESAPPVFVSRVESLPPEPSSVFGSTSSVTSSLIDSAALSSLSDSALPVSSILFGSAPLGSSPLFGSTPPAAPSLFGSAPPASSSLFGSALPASSSLFGSAPPASSSLFGSAPPASSSLFGSAPQASSSFFVSAPQASSSLFGSAPPTSSSLFGSAPPALSSLFGSAPPASSSLSGSAPQASSSLFGSAPPASSSLFGSAPPASSSLSGSTPQASSSLFGSAPPESSSLFGSAPPESSSLFGSAPPASSLLFGSAPPASSSLFGSAPPASSSLFGSAPPASSSLFGSASQASSSLFCSAPPASSSLFGSAPPESSSLFGSAPPAPSPLFGSAPPASSSLFGNAPPASSSLVGSAPPASSSLFGSSPPAAPSLLGSAPPESTSLFGSAPQATSSLFGSAIPALSSLFDSAPTTSSSLFGSVPPAQSSFFGSAPPAQSLLFESAPQVSSLLGSSSPVSSSLFKSTSPVTPSLFGTEPQIPTSLFESAPELSSFGNAPKLSSCRRVPQVLSKFGMAPPVSSSLFRSAPSLAPSLFRSVISPNPICASTFEMPDFPNMKRDSHKNKKLPERSSVSTLLTFAGVTCIRRSEGHLKLQDLDMLLEGQVDQGYWELNDILDNLLNINSKQCQRILVSSGVNSLGNTAAEHIEQLVATILVIFSIMELFRQELYPLDVSSAIKLCLKLGHVGKCFDIRTWRRLSLRFAKISELKEALRKASDFCIKTERLHPLVYSTLELGTSWANVAANFMQSKAS